MFFVGIQSHEYLQITRNKPKRGSKMICYRVHADQNRTLSNRANLNNMLELAEWLDDAYHNRYWYKVMVLSEKSGGRAVLLYDDGEKYVIEKEWRVE